MYKIGRTKCKQLDEGINVLRRKKKGELKKRRKVLKELKKIYLDLEKFHLCGGVCGGIDM